jgi:hypothetical protein
MPYSRPAYVELGRLGLALAEVDMPRPPYPDEEETLQDVEMTLHGLPVQCGAARKSLVARQRA